MVSYTDLKKGMVIVWNGEPYEVVEMSFVRMQQRKAVVQSKLKQLKSGKVVDRSWQASDEVVEAEVERRELTFLYAHRGEYWFEEPGNPKARLAVSGETLGGAARFLKPKTPTVVLLVDGKPMKVILPIKMEFTVTEAPPALRGNTAQGGTKQVTLEGGVTVSVPLFVNEGDTVRINTETGEYAERVEKAK